MQIDPWPLVIGAGVIALLLALFSSVASYDLSAAFLFYQSPALWSVISVVSSF
jgi:hypothetical protein